MLVKKTRLTKDLVFRIKRLTKHRNEHLWNPHILLHWHFQAASRKDDQLNRFLTYSDGSSSARWSSLFVFCTQAQRFHLWCSIQRALFFFVFFTPAPIPGSTMTRGQKKSGIKARLVTTELSNKWLHPVKRERSRYG